MRPTESSVRVGIRIEVEASIFEHKVPLLPALLKLVEFQEKAIAVGLHKVQWVSVDVVQGLLDECVALLGEASQ